MTNVQAHFTKRRAVALFRVSTARQGKSGLGLEAQREAVHRFMGDDWLLVDEIVEVASGRPGQRDGLDRALSLCRAHNAVLLIARLCRLSRDPLFLLELEKSGVEFIATDMPMANTLTIRMMSILAAEEARLVSERTRQALAARRERGLPLGGNNPNIGKFSALAAASSATARAASARQRARDLLPVIEDIKCSGRASLAKIAGGLNDRGIPTPRGARWQPQSVRNLLRLQSALAD
tara:strand:- start:34 stop:741 length:708 start_codon:yes stop_codon:yes gene_type:complete